MCWGLNDRWDFTLNDGDGGWIYGGQLDAPSGVFSSVSAGGLHSCGVRVDGGVVCWGTDLDGNYVGQADAPSGVFSSVSAGGLHSCGVRVDGGVVCWGSNDYGESNVPSGVFSSVSAGNEHSCGVRVDGGVVCWGLNDRWDSTLNDGDGGWIYGGSWMRRRVSLWPLDLPHGDGLTPILGGAVVWWVSVL